MGLAIAALEEGMAGSFLQTAAASIIKQLVTKRHLVDAGSDRLDRVQQLDEDDKKHTVSLSLSLV